MSRYKRARYGVYIDSEEAHHKEQNMAGCCMSIYDIWHGHVRILPLYGGGTTATQRRYSSRNFAFTPSGGAQLPRDNIRSHQALRSPRDLFHESFDARSNCDMPRPRSRELDVRSALDVGKHAERGCGQVRLPQAR